MKNGKPRVSIGLPVYNGENYVASAIDSILAQTFTDFELIISDNASTDKTAEICRAYAAKDSRIRYYRNEVNIGGPKNFNRVFELASGDYFKWAHHDDMMAPEFLERCVEVLDQDPAIVLVFSKVNRIGESGAVEGNYDHELRVDAANVCDRFHDLVRVRHWCYEQFGLIRSEALRKMPLFGDYIASDMRFMAELALLGRWCIIPEYLFYRRNHPDASSNMFPMQARVSWFSPSKAGKITFPHFKESWEYFKCVNRVPLKWSERKNCYLILLRHLKARGPYLVNDLEIAAAMYMHRSKLGRGIISLAKRATGHKVKTLYR